MKMLRFIYALLALAIAFMGSLLASLSYMIGFPFLFFIGLSIMLLGACVGIICLISWLGLIIAYKPELALVTSAKIKSRLTLLTVLIVLDVISYYGLRTIHESISSVEHPLGTHRVHS